MESFGTLKGCMTGMVAIEGVGVFAIGNPKEIDQHVIENGGLFRYHEQDQFAYYVAPKVTEFTEFKMRIDWSLLRNQKTALLESINSEKSKERQELLEGILHLIDNIQDYAVDFGHVENSKVFG